MKAPTTITSLPKGYSEAYWQKNLPTGKWEVTLENGRKKTITVTAKPIDLGANNPLSETARKALFASL